MLWSGWIVLKMQPAAQFETANVLVYLTSAKENKSSCQSKVRLAKGKEGIK
jgi:hypothetical protein